MTNASFDRDQFAVGRDDQLLDGWTWKTVGEMLLDAQYGTSAKTSGDASGIPVLRMGNIRDGNLILDRLKFLPRDHNEFPDLFLQDGDLVFNRTNSAELVGKTAVYRGNPSPCSFASYLIRLRLKPGFVPEFLAHYINSPVGRRQIAPVISQQVGQANVNGTKLKGLQVPVPPLAEQQRIVAEIQKQLTRIESGLTTLNDVRSNLKRYRYAVMGAACAGTLVPTEAILAINNQHAYQSADELIAQTKAPARPGRWGSRSRDVIEGHAALGVGAPRTQLPEGWAWCPLVDIARMESGHTPSRQHPECWGGNVPWISLPDARDHDGRVIQDTTQHTNEAGLENSAARLLPAGTVCISRTASVGYVVVMGQPMATSQDFVNWIPTAAVTSDWLRIVFSADREALRRFGKGSVHNTIYFPEWLSVHIALPPLAEQQRIVAEVERHLSVIDEIERFVDTNLQRAVQLRSSILDKAFSGRLLKSNITDKSTGKTKETSPASRRHFLRALLSAEIVHKLHAEPTFGQIKHQKIFHLCEHIAEIGDLEVQYHRDAAGPYDNRLIYANEAELKRQKWYESYSRKRVGHSYRPLAKAGGHEKYLERYWPKKTGTIRRLIHLMRHWDTERCEIFSTAYAAWNDLLLWGIDVTDDSILHEVLHRWHESKQRIPEKRWRKALEWMRKEGFVPTGFGKPTTAARP